MAVTISTALLFGVLLAFLLKSGNLGAGSCFVAVMFGFFLASTGAAPTVNRLTATIAHTLATLGH
ncbi:MAG: hypothetical protein JO362_10710 [Streptomycetaceae bacterium]|nr:hypothetical protein [Streptomycetaceae bacterium]